MLEEDTLCPSCGNPLDPCDWTDPTTGVTSRSWQCVRHDCMEVFDEDFDEV